MPNLSSQNKAVQHVEMNKAHLGYLISEPGDEDVSTVMRRHQGFHRLNS